MEEINKKEVFIDDAIDSINGIVRAEAPPFFYTRLQARLLKQEESSSVPRFIGLLTKPVFSVATLSLFVLLNLLAIKSITKEKKEMPTASPSADASLKNFEQEYDLSVSTLYGDNKNGE
jgi:hypothetical protein